jgi:hypothetical protein
MIRKSVSVLSRLLAVSGVSMVAGCQSLTDPTEFRLEGRIETLKIERTDERLSLTTILRNASASSFNASSLSEVQLVLIPLDRSQGAQNEPILYIIRRKASLGTAYSIASEMDLASRFTVAAGTSRLFTYRMENIGVYGVSAASNADASAYTEKELRLSDIDFDQKFRAILRVDLTGAPVQVDQATRSIFGALVMIERNPAMFAVKGNAYVLQ